MLDTEWATGNIFKKLRSQTKSSIVNILYDQHQPISDTLLKDALPDFSFIDKNTSQSVFNFDFTTTNSVFMSMSDIHNIHNTYTNIILFNHEDISDIKKEDKAILNNNLKNIKIINFDSKSNNVFDKSLNINYPFPNLSPKVDKIKDVLILNTQKESFNDNLYNNIKQTNISVDITQEMTGTISSIYDQLCQYRVVIDISNRINQILALLAGCNVICHKSTDGYFESQYIIKFDSHTEIIDAIRYSLNKQQCDTNDLKKQYSSENFSNDFKEYILCK